MATTNYDAWRRDGDYDWHHAGELDWSPETDDDFDPQQALQQAADDLDDTQAEWLEQNEDAIADAREDDPTFDPMQAHAAWKDGWLAGARAYLTRHRAMPPAGISGMLPDAWLAQRRQDAITRWPPHGDEAIERETFVREALIATLLPAQRQAIARDPSIVRAALDPAMAFYVVPTQRHPEHVVVLTQRMFPEMMFRLAHGDLEPVRARLEEITGTRWTFHVGQDNAVTFVEGAPVVTRNPKSMIASSPAWTTARDKLRSAAVKKNPVPTKTKALEGGMTLIVEQHEYGYSAYLQSREGQRIPASFGDYTPTDLQDALEAAERWLNGFKLTRDLSAAAPMPRTKTYEHNSPKGRPSAEVRARQLETTIAQRIAPGQPATAYRNQRARAAAAARPEDVPRRPRVTVTNPQAALLEDAKAKFEEFHRKAPTKIGEFFHGLQIPHAVGELGRAIHILYRSLKKDPSTGRQPKKPVDYIHEHYAGVKMFQVDNDDLAQVEVPAFIREADALVLLGQCMGFRFECDGEPHDAEGTQPLPELYCTPCGKALLIIQDKRELLAMSWGGGLGVWARGIDG